MPITITVITQSVPTSKINRNRYIKFASGSLSVSTKSCYDNYFVQHQIPRSDIQYAWMTASIDDSSFDDFEGERISFYETDYPNLDYVSVIGNTNSVGIPKLVMQNNNPTCVILPHNHYTYPSWKQVRVGDMYENKWNRRYNYMSIRDGIKIDESSGIKGVFDSTSTYIEPVVSWNHPVEQGFIVRVDPSIPGVKQIPIKDLHPEQYFNASVLYSYFNEEQKFANEEINEALQLELNKDLVYDSFYYKVKDETDEFEFDYISYIETIYPKHIHVGSWYNRDRIYYGETTETGEKSINSALLRTIWRDELVERKRPEDSLTCIDECATASYVWQMPGWGGFNNSFNSMDTTYDYDNLGFVRGDLGFLFDTWYMYDVIGAASVDCMAGPLYCYSHNLNKMSGYSWVDLGITYFTDLISGEKKWYDSYSDYSSDTKPIGQNYGIIPEFNISNHMEYYIINNGGNFRTNNKKFLEVKGGGFISRVSCSSDDYINYDEDFFDLYAHSDLFKNLSKVEEDYKGYGEKIFSLKVSAIKKLLPYNGFYPMDRSIQLVKLFYDSYFPYVEGSGSWQSSTSDRALTKQSLLQPFFAPGIFYNFIKSGVAVDWMFYTGSEVPSDSNSMQSYLTESYLVDADVQNQNYIYILESGSNHRFPFEALINPENYMIKKGNSYDSSLHENDDEKSQILYLNPTNLHHNTSQYVNKYPYFTWTGHNLPLYTMAINNFLAETANFFLEKRGYTTFLSKKQNEFQVCESGTYYISLVDLKKTNGFDMFIQNYISGTSGSYFGPPCKFAYSSSSPSPVQINTDPMYAPYCPPYFYGTSEIAFFFQAKENKKYTLSEIFSELQFVEMNREQETNFKTYYSAYPDATPNPNNYLTTLAYLEKMSLSASVNFKGLVRQKEVEYNDNGGPVAIKDTTSNENDRWAIYLKAECPVLNFNNEDNEGFESAYINGETIKVVNGVGMWGGYGQIPNNKEGIFLSIKDLNIKTENEILYKSLIDLVGFEKKQEQVGKLAENTIMSEAVVLVPFLDYSFNEPGYVETTEIVGKHFIKIDKEEFNKAKSETNISTSISALISKMSLFNFPPELDFIRYHDIVPFVMYVFDFHHVFSKNDLKNIWQGQMPNIAKVAQKDEYVITHPLSKKEFFHGKKLPKDLRWLIFKVKQKALKSYYEVTADSFDDNRFKFKFKNMQDFSTLEYNYNWPYDFCSLVESVKIDGQLIIDKKPDENQKVYMNKEYDFDIEEE